MSPEQWDRVRSESAHAGRALARRDRGAASRRKRSCPTGRRSSRWPARLRRRGAQGQSSTTSTSASIQLTRSSSRSTRSEKTMPIVSRGILWYNDPNGNYVTNGSGRRRARTGSGSRTGSRQRTHQLLAELAPTAKEAAAAPDHERDARGVRPDGQTPALRVSRARATTLPALGGLSAGSCSPSARRSSSTGPTHDP